MQCPVCKEAQLILSDRQGIEIDYCPQCRGVWLDRGELDKLIERAAPRIAPTPIALQRMDTPAQSQAPYAPVPERGGYHNDHYPGNGRYRDDDDDDHDHYRRKKKRGGFLGELFDFD